MLTMAMVTASEAVRETNAAHQTRFAVLAVSSQPQLRTLVPVKRAPDATTLMEQRGSYTPRARWAYFSNANDMPARPRSVLVGDELLMVSVRRPAPFAPGFGEFLRHVSAPLQPALVTVAPLARPIGPAAVLSQYREKQQRAAAPPPLGTQTQLRMLVDASQVEEALSAVSGPGKPKWHFAGGGGGGAISTPASRVACEHLMVLFIEAFAPTSLSAFVANPERDAVTMVTYALHYQSVERRSPAGSYQLQCGVLAVADPLVWDKRAICGVFNLDIFPSEREMLAYFCCEFVPRIVDPDLVVGFELQRGSLRYIMERARIMGMHDEVAKLGRVPGAFPFRAATPAAPTNGNDDGGGGGGEGAADGGEDGDRADEGKKRAAGMARKIKQNLQVTGRITLSLWEALRGEISLGNYSYESCVFHLLHRTVPLFDPIKLSEWYRGSVTGRLAVMRHFLERCQNSYAMMSALKIVERTSQLAKVRCYRCCVAGTAIFPKRC